MERKYVEILDSPSPKKVGKAVGKIIKEKLKKEKNNK